MKQVLHHLQAMAFPRRKPRAEGPRYGDTMERAMAAALDLCVLYVLFFDIFQWAQQILYRGVDPQIMELARTAPHALDALGYYWQAGVIRVWLINSLLQYAVIGLFVVTVQSLFHTTPGKWLLGLKIVRRRTFAPVPTWRYAVRYLAYLPSVAPLMLGVIWANFNKEQRTWHDMIAGTVVLQTRGYGWYWKQMKRGFAWLTQRGNPPSTPPSAPDA